LPLHPALAGSGFVALGAMTSCPAVVQDLPAPPVMCPELLLRFAEVSDGRRERGRVHPGRGGARLCAAPPSKAAVWRVATGADARGPEGGSPELVAIAVDGETVRGVTDTRATRCSYSRPRPTATLWSWAGSRSARRATRSPCPAPLLDGLAEVGVDLTRAVITADALHTPRAHARYLHERGVGLVFTVEQNQPGLFAVLDALPRSQIPIAPRDIDTGHGRITTRTLPVLPAPEGLPFPHLNQAWLTERHTRDPADAPRSAVAAPGVTNPPARPGTPGCLATFLRHHWGIESPHWPRDTVYGEDNSTARTRSGLRVTAALRNLAIGTIQLTGRRDITEATRSASRDMHRPFKILKPTPSS